MKKCPANWRPAKGDLVEIQILDHSQADGEAKLLTFTVLGCIKAVTKKGYMVYSWYYTDDDDIDDNCDGHMIVRSAIVSMTKLTKEGA